MSEQCWPQGSKDRDINRFHECIVNKHGDSVALISLLFVATIQHFYESGDLGFMKFMVEAEAS